MKKSISTRRKKIVFIYNKELTEKKFKKNSAQLDLNSDFYNSEEKNKKKILKILDDTYKVNNLVKESIKLDKQELFWENIIYT
ncbi:hypothetical protein ISS05_00785 [Candidatus Woesearchaeota archaeon]|nr:hypothetical protein [Candidatus Woesearchaeota archaeon]